MKDLLQTFFMHEDEFTEAYDGLIEHALEHASEGDLLMAGEKMRLALAVVEEAIQARDAAIVNEEQELTWAINADIANGGSYANPLDR